MKRLFIGIIFLGAFSSICAFQSKKQSAFTYQLSGGRFGDNVISLYHGLWFEYKYDIPLLYNEFNYSDQLMIHEKRVRYNDIAIKQSFSSIIELKRNSFVEIRPDTNSLYVIPFFPESLEEHRKIECSSEVFINVYKGGSRTWPYFHVDWDDSDFIAKIKAVVAPRKTIRCLEIPKGYISVALHIRKPGVYDDFPLLSEIPLSEYSQKVFYMDVNYPLKFPPNSYYIEQLKFIKNMYVGQKLYVFIFTDDAHPEVLIEKYAKELNDENIIFDYHQSNSHDRNVLEDFFSIAKFDCLIRSDSNFALAASKIGNFKVQIAPLHHRWIGKKLYIDKVDIIIAKNI